MEKWLQKVIQAVDPWISTDIEKGARWSPEISKKLGESKVGIICLTPENLDSNWILYEAGALSKTEDARVCTLLLDLKPPDVEAPLATFQHTRTTKSDVLKLLRTINRAVERAAERGLDGETLKEVFDDNWKRLSDDLARIGKITPDDAESRPRPDRELLEEVLQTVRRLDRRPPATEPVPPQFLGEPASLDPSMGSSAFLVGVSQLLEKERRNNTVREVAEALRIWAETRAAEDSTHAAGEGD